MRIVKFLKLYEDGKTLQEIGISENLTWQRVQQILSLSPIYKRLRKERIESHYEIISCLMCQKKVRYLKSQNYFLCLSKKCHKKFIFEKTNLKYSRPRRCCRCKKIKSPGEFYPLYGRRPELKAPHCKMCRNKITDSYNKRNPEKIREINLRATRKYYLKLKSKRQAGRQR